MVDGWVEVIATHPLQDPTVRLLIHVTRPSSLNPSSSSCFSQRPLSLNKWLPFRLHIHHKCKCTKYNNFFWQTSTHLHFNLAEEGGRFGQTSAIYLIRLAPNLPPLHRGHLHSTYSTFPPRPFLTAPKLFGLSTHISTLNF